MSEATPSEAERAEVARFWEERYRQQDQIWSGRANAVLVDVVAALPPGRALDLGCGEGGDALWLAERGWQVTAVDLSATALARAAAAATAAGVSERISFEQHDLSTSFPEGTFELISAQYFQSPVALPRERILPLAARAVAPGGLLLIVDHGAAPSWADSHGAHPNFPTPEATLAALALPAAGWRVERSELADRETTAPNGEPGTLIDSIVAVRRLS